MSEAILIQLTQLAARLDQWTDLRGSIAQERYKHLFDSASAEFGSWENALAAALCRASRSGGGSSTTSSRSSSAGPVEADHQRSRQDGWDGPMVVFGTDDTCFYLAADTFPTLTSLPAPMETFAPRGEPIAARLVVPNPFEGFLVFVSDRGMAYGIDGRIVPHASGIVRHPADMVGVASDELIKAAFDRLLLRRGRRFFHVSVSGKIKATDASEFGRGPFRDGEQAFLLAEHDGVCNAFVQSEADSTIFCANLGGNGIHFSASDVRSMGFKAQGVKAMELGDAFDAIVGAFCTDGVEQFIALSAQGYGKRIRLSEFRVQGRGGQGMILMRPHAAGDELAALIPLASLDNDIMVTTLGGRMSRIAATAVPLLDRAARGIQVVEVPDGDRVGSCCRLFGSG